MKKTLRPVLCIFLLLSLFFFTPQSAFACSGGEHNAIADSEIIVGGWITNWDVMLDMPVHYTTPIKVQMQVDRVFKGNVATGSLLEFIDVDSLFNDNPLDWGGGGNGTCGAFNVDPKGKYAIIGAVKDKDGHYQTNIWITFYIGDHPPTTLSAQGINFTQTDLQKLVPSFLPTSGGDDSDSSRLLLIAGVSLLGLGIMMRRVAKSEH